MNLLLQEDVMFFERFHGKTDIGDIDTKDNAVTNMVFFAGFIVTLLVAIMLLMYFFVL